MESSLYFGPPVEAVQVTTSNMEEVAEWCGGRIASWEKKAQPGREFKYIWVPVPRGTKVYWAYPGMWVVKRKATNSMGVVKTTLAVFHREYFEKNFFENPVLAAGSVSAVGVGGRVQPGNT
jgi:hypothetical protein